MRRSKHNRNNSNPTRARPNRQPLPELIVKNGDQYVLRDSSGQIFGLDDSEKAKPFEGKTVKVTGQLDEQAKVIHVEDIEAAEG